jgi:hypothetical protein
MDPNTELPSVEAIALSLASIDKVRRENDLIQLEMIDQERKDEIMWKIGDICHQLATANKEEHLKFIGPNAPQTGWRPIFEQNSLMILQINALL